MPVNAIEMTLADLAPSYNLCRFCLMCRHVCPVGRITKHESNTPHGWALLISSVDRGQMRWDSDAVDTLYQCAQCNLCLANCFTDQPLPSAIAAARAHVTSIGAAPESVMALDAKLKEWGNPYAEVEPVASEGRADVGLFVGAAAQHLRPQTLAAARKLLDILGIEHLPMGVGLASAYLPYALGLRETARLLAQSALREVAASGCSRLIVLTPQDAHSFKHILPELGLPLPDGVEVIELITLLADGIESGRLSLKPMDHLLTYHDPALTPLFLTRTALARRALSALTVQPLREMFWREGRAAPGGAVGGLEFTHPALAERMTRERLVEAASTGAEVLVTEDPAALASFTTQADGTPIKIEGLYELLVQQLVR